MAFAQVMSNTSRKQEHLEAGKRRLEEFRKKKAAAKKAAPTTSTSQPCNGDSIVNEKRASENGQVQFSNFVGVAADVKSDAVTEASGFLYDNDKSLELTYASGSKSAVLAQVNAQSDDFVSPDLLQVQPKQERNNYTSLGLKSQTSSAFNQEKENSVGSFSTDSREGIYGDVISSIGSADPRDDSNNYLLSTFHGVEGHLSSKDISSSESLSNITASRNGVAVRLYPEAPATNLSHESVQPTLTLAANISEPFTQNSTLEVKDHSTFWLGGRKLNTAEGNLSRFYTHQASDPPSAGLDYNATLNGPLYSSVADNYVKRSRSSFLDSLNIGRDSPTSGLEKEKYTGSLKFLSSDLAASSVMQEPSTTCAPVEPLPTTASSNTSGNYFGSTFMGQYMFENNLESELETTSRRQNEDFSALEQHIEDLTQEKFSLQRALEASKTLAESLAGENSSLTESYNQQASMLNQLKVEIESLQREIKARLVELEATKAEYMNAQLECNAADERAKLLASEVIGLEEKALRLRSNELKLEREMENASSEIASYKKKLGSLEKEHQDLLQTIDALQEEKRLLQSKFRKSSPSAISVDNNRGNAKTDASTFTDDLDLDAAGINVQTQEDTGNLLQLLQSRHETHDDLSMTIPADQVQMIQNINSLISEIKVEKEKLMQALVAEVSTSTRLKDLNKELSHKLETQTQRLELLTAQSMASEITSPREPTSSHVVRESVAYADEGDEVVERVIGWIMKLFPGGPSTRKPSRL